MCQAESCRGTCGVSSLYQLALRDLCSLSTLHAAVSPDISGKSLRQVTHLTCHRTEDCQLPKDLMKTKGQDRDCSFIHSCSQNRDCSHRQHTTIFFPISPQTRYTVVVSFNLKSKTCQFYHCLLLPCPSSPSLSLFPAPGPRGAVRTPASSSGRCLLHLSLFGRHPLLCSSHVALVTWLLSFTSHFCSHQSQSLNYLSQFSQHFHVVPYVRPFQSAASFSVVSKC